MALTLVIGSKYYGAFCGTQEFADLSFIEKVIRYSLYDL